MWLFDTGDYGIPEIEYMKYNVHLSYRVREYIG